jgi:hypothetical protein
VGESMKRKIAMHRGFHTAIEVLRDRKRRGGLD